MDDPSSGGFVRVPSNVTNAHVLMPDNTWRLRWELKDGETPREFGGCAQLGSGQLIPMEGVRVPEPQKE